MLTKKNILQVLLDTTQMYYYLFHKTPSMPLKRVIMILGASLEFEKKYNKEIVERPTDDIEVPQVKLSIKKMLYTLFVSDSFYSFKFLLYLFICS